MIKQRGWFYRNFICGHWVSGEIRKEYGLKRTRHYRFCQKCGKKFYID